MESANRSVEYRKLISFGNSSYVVSLPKHWLERKDLEKGDSVCVNVHDSSIVIQPESPAEEPTKQEEIEVRDVGDEVLKRRIIDAYVHNADRITITGELQSKREAIQDAADVLTAMETTEDGRSVTLESFLDIRDVTPEELFRKMDHIINDMFKDLRSVTERNQIEAAALSDDITERDRSVNRICFLLLRTINAQLETLTDVQEADLPSLWGRTFFLEDIGDDVKRIARLLVNIEDEVETVTDLLGTVYERYRDCMEAYFTDDKDQVYALAECREETMQACEEIRELGDAPVFVSLTDRMKQLVAKIHSLNRIAY